MKDLKELLAQECNHRFSMDTPVMRRFIDSLREEHLKRGEILTRYGKLDTNIYVIRSGIIRLTYFDGLQEKTFAFGSPGTISVSMHSYYMRMPSFFQSEACTDVVVMKMPKQEFDALLDESQEFARWVLDRTLDQLCGLEMKLDRVNGQAYERYSALVKIMPEVAGSVSAKIIASYLGITPAYLSQLKKRYKIRMEKNEGEIDPFTSQTVKGIR